MIENTEQSLHYPKEYSFLNKIISWIITPFYNLFFFSILVIFDPILRISYLFNNDLFQKVLELMNWAIIYNLKITAGTEIKIIDHNSYKDLSILSESPLIIISNHQSMYDIPFIICYLRKFKPKFISKKELARYIPGISFSLRNMGSVIINRKDKVQSLNEIQNFSKKLEEENLTCCLFPEGTRARDGILKDFKIGGFANLVKNAPNANILPVVISGSWKLLRYNLLPIPFHTEVNIHFLDIIKPQFGEGICDNKKLLKEIQIKISEKLESKI